MTKHKCIDLKKQGIKQIPHSDTRRYLVNEKIPKVLKEMSRKSDIRRFEREIELILPAIDVLELFHKIAYRNFFKGTINDDYFEVFGFLANTDGRLSEMSDVMDKFIEGVGDFNILHDKAHILHLSAIAVFKIYCVNDIEEYFDWDKI